MNTLQNYLPFTLHQRYIGVVGEVAEGAMPPPLENYLAWHNRNGGLAEKIWRA